MTNLSKNFTNRPPEAPISQAMQTGGGSPSPMMHQPDENAPTSKNFGKPVNQAVSRNFAEADKAARAALKPQGGATHAALRRPW